MAKKILKQELAENDQGEEQNNEAKNQEGYCGRYKPQ